MVAVSYFACKIVVKALDHDEKDNLLLYSICTEYASKAVTVDAVESLLEVHKVELERSLSFRALHDDVTQREYLVYTSLSCWSTASFSRWIIIFTRILQGMDKSVIPRQLLQLLRAPFFGIFTVIPSNQSLGISFLSHMVVKCGRSVSALSSRAALNNSALRLSCLGALLFFRDLIAEKISSFSCGAVLPSSSCSSS